jgi:NADH-quinone oxidoreductase subunit E
MLSGAKNIINFIEDFLRIKVGETTQDRKITLRTVECQGSCCSAPVLLVDKIFYDHLTISKVKDIIKSLE